jgi:glycosyltransferase involved in cell wall biosynthesis
MRYNAGSEVYSQTLCQELADRHEVHVFTRGEDPFKADYVLSLEEDKDDSRIKLHVINLLSDRHRYRYRHQKLDQEFAKILDTFCPNVIHIGHLNHLSTSLVWEAYQRAIPIVFTLHDYWIMCPRGQFMQRLGEDQNSLWPSCTGQEDRKCAVSCYAGCASGAPDEWSEDVSYWQGWVARRMSHMREMTKLVDHFIAPAHYLYNRFIADFALPEHKISYLDYGFDLTRFATLRNRQSDESFTFGYIGTHIPAKGIQHLIEAFGLVESNCLLRIWGRFSQNTGALQNIAKALGGNVESRIEWLGEYRNADIMEDVFNKVDCIIVPSIWVENSPLVIHEALQARLPVITANAGGMAEYITHGKNGLLFEHRNVKSLAAQMAYLAEHPSLAVELGNNGYLQAEDRNIPDIKAHALEIEQIYEKALKHRTQPYANQEPRPVADYF